MECLGKNQQKSEILTMTNGSKTVFLDRDGVLIHDVHYLSDLKQIEFFSDVPDGLRKLKNKGYQLIMITNQSGVARGYFDESFVLESFQYINRILKQADAELDMMYFCPHHPDGYPPLNIVCDCRKPATGMIRKATKEFKVDNEKSYMIGDKYCDIELAANAHIKGIHLATGYGKEHSKKVMEKFPKTPYLNTFSEAVEYILLSD